MRYKTLNALEPLQPGRICGIIFGRDETQWGVKEILASVAVSTYLTIEVLQCSSDLDMSCEA